MIRWASLHTPIPDGACDRCVVGPGAFPDAVGPARRHLQQRPNLRPQPLGGVAAGAIAWWAPSLVPQPPPLRRAT
jgi:hypothetical protein